MTTQTKPFAETPLGLGIKGLCPRCHKGHIFDGFLKLSARCEVCDLDFSFADPADGPAFFAMSIVSFPIVGMVAWFEVALNMPLWLNLMIGTVLLVGASCALLRPLKGWLVCSQYINKAEPARLAEPDEPKR